MVLVLALSSFFLLCEQRWKKKEEVENATVVGAPVEVPSQVVA